MKAQQAKSKHSAKGHTCRICNTQVRAGQWFIERRCPNAPITERWFTMHVKCIKALTDGIPEDEDKTTAAFHQLRSKGRDGLRDHILQTN